MNTPILLESSSACKPLCSTPPGPVQGGQREKWKPAAKAGLSLHPLLSMHLVQTFKHLKAAYEEDEEKAS
jgi:hypothetical protein